MQLLQEERQKNSGFNPHILRKKVELRLVTDKEEKKSLGNAGIFMTASRRLLDTLRPKPSKWAGRMETFMKWVSDPEITYCRRMKFVKDGGGIFMGVGREKRILHASRC